MEDIYDRLMLRLDEFPLGAPRSDNLRGALSMIFTPDEAELFIDLPLRPETLPEIAARLGRDEASLEALLESMANRGTAYCRERNGLRQYCALPLVPGIFELQFMKAEVNPAKRRIAELFDAYYHEGWGASNFANVETPMTRVLPVEEEISRKDQVLPYEKVSEYIKDSTFMCLTNCFCRHEAELLGRSCGAPKDVCMAFGPFAEYMVNRGFGWRASREEMLEALDRAEKAGLVHITDNVQDRIGFICNCCGCCCGFLGTITKLGLANAVAASRFVATADADLCNGCETCVDECQLKAISLSDDEAAVVNPEKCIGCGICASHCPAEAMSVLERTSWQEPKPTFLDLGMAIMTERGKV
jgi:NAD-dependent dihydropyrimidine dehydrogenase PreA subunit